MTPEEFQADAKLVAQWKTVVDLPIFYIVRKVLADSHPLLWPVNKLGLPESDNSKQLGRLMGYQTCLDNLDALSVYKEPPKEVEAVFEPEQITKK